MKYSIFEVANKDEISKHVSIVYENSGLSFPAEVGNPNYDAFLVSAKLTDEEVHALEPDVWYNFPTEETI